MWRGGLSRALVSGVSGVSEFLWQWYWPFLRSLWHPSLFRPPPCAPAGPEQTMLINMNKRTGTNQKTTNNNILRLLLKSSLIKTRGRITCQIGNLSRLASVIYISLASWARGIWTKSVMNNSPLGITGFPDHLAISRSLGNIIRDLFPIRLYVYWHSNLTWESALVLRSIANASY